MAHRSAGVEGKLEPLDPAQQDRRDVPETFGGVQEAHIGQALEDDREGLLHLFAREQLAEAQMHPGAEGDLLNRLKQNFTSVKHAKPKASRSDSAEKYVVATGFRGRA